MMCRRLLGMWLLALCSVGASVGNCAAAPLPLEQARIDKLIFHVETQKGMKFIRNGTEYTCTEAARFLRGKMESMGGDVTTAREFIDRIATKSSMSGRPYHVQFSDGQSITAAQFLGEELKRLEGLPP